MEDFLMNQNPLESKTHQLQLVDSKAAARLLGVCERTLWDLGALGQIPRVRIGRCVRFQVSDLQRWIDEQKTGGAA
jgi:excisionase family DNA binding protein